MSGYHILGDATDSSLTATVNRIGERVHPWLWVISLAGFFMSAWTFWHNRSST